MQKYALLIEYDGTHFKGWQKQATPPVRSIEEELTHAVSFVANHEVEIVGAGRTDAGVHAFNQIAHFETDAKRSAFAWKMGINSNLPEDIVVKGIFEVPDDFHARFKAVARTYKYFIRASEHRSALTRFHHTWIHYPLSPEKMQEAANYLLGEQDFSAFRSSECQSKSTHRNVHYIKIIPHSAEVIEIEIKANAFLHHMVRNIAGNLIEIGRGKFPPIFMKEVLDSRDRTKGAMTAPPQGLYLYEVEYPNLQFIV